MTLANDQERLLEALTRVLAVDTAERYPGWGR